MAAPAVRAAVFVVLALLTACAPRLSAPGGVPGAPAPPAAVERFLQLAAARDYATMGWIFGNANGPILDRDPVPEVEQRMYALAGILQHDGFVVGNGVPVPGRTSDAVLFDVIMTRGATSVRVPFTAVRGPRSRWFVERVDVEAIIGR